jgi:molybdopterin molybdotransferase
MTRFERIDRPGCGCEAAGKGDALVTIDEALARIAAETAAIDGHEPVPLRKARGRVLAEPVHARAMTPPFDAAAMDGYAVTAASFEGRGPWTLDIAGRLPAGRRARTRVDLGSAIRIFTGAPLPDGADVVVMQEDAIRSGDRVTLARRPEPGENVRRAGDDMARGALVVEAGRTLGPRDIAACAAAGHGEVIVRRRLRVVLLVTGDETTEAGRSLDAAEIWDVNTPMMTAALTAPAIDLVAVLRCADDREAVIRALAKAAAGADLVITTGGVSVGDEDHVKPALRDLGARIVFAGVAMKPGKPVSFGRIGQALWLGLPGNPLSACVTWMLFGTALIRALCGAVGETPPKRHVTTGRSIRRQTGRCEVRPVRLAGFDASGREIVDFEPSVQSNRVARLPQADGVIFLPADTDWLPEGALVEFLPFPDM